jgi:hypothetical protein
MSVNTDMGNQRGVDKALDGHLIEEGANIYADGDGGAPTCRDANPQRLAKIRAMLQGYSQDLSGSNPNYLSFFDLMSRGFAVEMDLPGLILSCLRMGFTLAFLVVLAIYLRCVSATSSEPSECKDVIFIALLVLCGVFTVLDILYALVASPFFTDYRWRRDNTSKFGIVDVKEYVFALCSAEPIMTLWCRPYWYDTEYRTIHINEDESREEAYEVRREGEAKTRIFEYSEYADATELPPIEKFARSSLLIVCADVSYSLESDAIKKRFSKEREEHLQQAKRSTMNSWDSGAGVKLSDRAKFQYQKLAAWDIHAVPILARYATESHIALAFLGLHWFYAKWMQGFCTKVHINVKKQILY